MNDGEENVKGGSRSLGDPAGGGETALTLGCPARGATPTRQRRLGEVGVVCDVDGVEAKECEVFCREEEVCSAVCREGAAYQQIRGR